MIFKRHFVKNIIWMIFHKASCQNWFRDILLFYWMNIFHSNWNWNFPILTSTLSNYYILNSEGWFFLSSSHASRPSQFFQWRFIYFCLLLDICHRLLFNKQFLTVLIKISQLIGWALGVSRGKMILVKNESRPLWRYGSIDEGVDNWKILTQIFLIYSQDFVSSSLMS